MTDAPPQRVYGARVPPRERTEVDADDPLPPSILPVFNASFLQPSAGLCSMTEDVAKLQSATKKTKPGRYLYIGLSHDGNSPLWHVVTFCDRDVGDAFHSALDAPGTKNFLISPALAYLEHGVADFLDQCQANASLYALLRDLRLKKDTAYTIEDHTERSFGKFRNGLSYYVTNLWFIH